MSCPLAVVAPIQTIKDVTNVASLSLVPAIIPQKELIILGETLNVEKAKISITDQLNNATMFKTFNLQKEEIQISREQVCSDLRGRFLHQDLNIIVISDLDRDDLPSIELCSLGAAMMDKAVAIVYSYFRECDYVFQWLSWPTSFNPNLVGHYKTTLIKFSEEWMHISGVFTGRPKGSSSENTDVYSIFKNTITKIEKTINPRAFRAYSRYVDELAKQNTEEASKKLSTFERTNEIVLKEGRTDPRTIADSDCGLNFNCHNKTNFYGRGANLAEDAFYVHTNDRCFTFHDSIHAQMFLARVAAGKIKEIKTRNNDHGLFKAAPTEYNPVRGPLSENHIGLVSYRQNSIYPAYLINYKKT